MIGHCVLPYPIFNHCVPSVMGARQRTKGAVVLAAVSIARNSSNYWAANFDEWRAAIEGGQVGQILEVMVNWGAINWASVAIMDVIAAVFVGVTAIALWMIPAIGWAAWGIGVIAAAVIVCEQRP
jgi:hypothetical protein